MKIKPHGLWMMGKDFSGGISNSEKLGLRLADEGKEEELFWESWWLCMSGLPKPKGTVFEVVKRKS